VQLLNDCVWSDSAAVPGAAGLEFAVALKVDARQVIPVLPFRNVAVVPEERPAVSPSPVATAVPPALPAVRTLFAACATPAGRMTSADAAATNTERYKILRIGYFPSKGCPGPDEFLRSGARLPRHAGPYRPSSNREQTRSPWLSVTLLTSRVG